MPANPPRAPGELAEIEAIILKHVRCQWSGEPFEGVTFVMLGQAEAAAEIAALRAPQGDGAEAMRERAAACAAGWRTPALTHAGLNEVEQDVARRTAAGIEAAILDLPLPALDQHTLTKNEGGER